MTPAQQKERRDIALEAAWETEALSTLIIEKLEELQVDEGISTVGIRGIAARILTVSRAVMSVLDDEDANLDQVRGRLGIEYFGKFPILEPEAAS